MTNRTSPHKLLFAALLSLLLSFTLQAQDHQPVGYVATYQILRDGKPTAKQTTELRALGGHRYSLKDRTKGTHGLASMTGFERTESTEFKLQGLMLMAIEHRMKQAVAFSKRVFQFKAAEGSNRIQGKHKKEAFELETDQLPVSAHMMPWWLGYQWCLGTQPKSVTVLKSKQLRTYQFKATHEADNTVRLDRVYPADADKSTSTWLDTQRHCLPIKTRHQEGDDPVIETVLKSHHLN